MMYYVSDLERFIEQHEVGFGPVEDKARFAINGWTEWRRPPIVRQRLIPGTGRSKTQIVGFLPYEVTYEILITHPNFRKLEERLQTVSDLILPDGASTYSDDVYPHHGSNYLVINSVRLHDIDEAINYDRQRMRCSVVFQRAT